MRLFTVWVALLAACGACGERHGPEGPEAPGRGQLRVMSYNVNFGLAGDLAGVRAVGQSNADVVLLQETNAEWETALVDTLGRRYPHHRFTHPEGWPGGGMGILSKLPIVSVDELPGSPFFAWRVVLDAPGGRMQVLNVHLRPPMSDGGSWVVGYFSTRDHRLAEIEQHLARLDRTLPTLIVGDFNEEGDGKALARLSELGYGDATAQFHGKQPTWQWTVGSASGAQMTLKFQLDHILHDASFIPVAARIVDGGRSDHKPIWTDFERTNPD